MTREPGEVAGREHGRNRNRQQVIGVAITPRGGDDASGLARRRPARCKSMRELQPAVGRRRDLNRGQSHHSRVVKDLIPIDSLDMRRDYRRVATEPPSRSDRV